MLTNERLSEIRQRCEAATLGPWFVHNDNEGSEYFPFWVISQQSAEDMDGEWFLELHVGDPPTAEFIANAREDIPALLAEIDRLRARYYPLLLSHLRVMKRDGDLYDAGGMKAAADLMRQMADQGLFEITVNGPGGRIMGRLTAKGLKLMGGGEC